MVAQDFFELVDKLSAGRYLGLEDFADKLSFLFSVIILLISTLVVTIKSYVIKPIACYPSVVPSGGNFEDFIENYCWVHGTVPVYPGQALPADISQWAEIEQTQKITYYQWIPFILGLQTVLFYLPRFIWQMFCFNKGGADLENIIKQAVSINEKPFSDQPGEYENLAKTIENMLVLHRDFRHGRKANIRRQIFRKCSFFMSSKRLGNMLVFWYFFIKLMYLINSIGQLLLMQKFLGFNDSIPSFGVHLASYIFSGRDWDLQNYFPRVTFCIASGIQHVGTQNNYVAQCVLPVNMLNEKIYTFLWFWTLSVAIITFISIPLWIVRVFRSNSRDSFVKKFLKMRSSYDESKKPLIRRFINDFLRHDGLFLMRMISNNAGDVIGANLINELWTIYLENYQNRNLRNDPELNLESTTINLEPGANSTKYKSDNNSTTNLAHYL